MLLPLNWLWSSFLYDVKFEPARYRSSSYVLFGTPAIVNFTGVLLTKLDEYDFLNYLLIWDDLGRSALTIG